MEYKKTFSNIYHNRLWARKRNESVSGTGSDMVETEVIRRELLPLLRKYHVQTLLDAPCGDFNWMRHVDLSTIDYVGGDVVDELVEENIRKYSGERRKFIPLDLIQGPIPYADMILCRDCLGHFSFSDIFEALRNIENSGAIYLLTTNYPKQKKDRAPNHSISTGRWFAINLESSPFFFPPPLESITEGCPTHGFEDKSLSLWRISDLPI